MFIYEDEVMATISVNKILIIFFFAILGIGCQIDQNERIDRSRFSFKCYTDSYTFFLNLRSFFYHREIKGDGQVIAFRYKDRLIDSARVQLNPTIAINSTSCNALIFLETTQAKDTLLIEIGKSTYALTTASPANVLEFCTVLYESIMQDVPAYFYADGKPIFTSPEEKEAFRIVMSDFYRLTRIF